jgi:hypothetical protein
MLEVRNIQSFLDFSSSSEISKVIQENCMAIPIEQINWKAFQYKPYVCFRIAQGKNSIFILFEVQEKSIRAKYHIDGGKVYTDSCVEFFVSPNNDGQYYNFEFNCIGTTLLGCRKERNMATPAPEEITRQIKRFSSLGNQPFEIREGCFTWSLLVEIPYTAFFRHSISSLKGKKIKANFYKCGDELTDPHYLSWQPIKTDRPDFHRPDFFGILQF